MSRQTYTRLSHSDDAVRNEQSITASWLWSCCIYDGKGKGLFYMYASGSSGST